VPAWPRSNWTIDKVLRRRMLRQFVGHSMRSLLLIKPEKFLLESAAPADLAVPTSGGGNSASMSATALWTEPQRPRAPQISAFCLDRHLTFQGVGPNVQREEQTHGIDHVSDRDSRRERQRPTGCG